MGAIIPFVRDEKDLQAGSSETPKIVSATNAACNIYSNVTYLVSY